LGPARKICYVSGTGADFGLIASTLQLAAVRPGLEVSVCVTGMHLSPTFGSTVTEIEAAGLRICDRIPVDVETASGASMAFALGHELIGLTTVFARERPDVVMVLGDRGEMLAGALAAIHLNIPVVHVHGGERSGTVDEPVRHAISKLSHYHFVSTEGARERLVRMKENIQQMRTACEADRKQFCRGVPLGGVAMLQCLESHAQEVSDRCFQFLPKPVRLLN